MYIMGQLLNYTGATFKGVLIRLFYVLLPINRFRHYKICLKSINLGTEYSDRNWKQIIRKKKYEEFVM